MATVPLILLGGYAAGASTVLVARAPLSRTWVPFRSRYFLVLLLFSATALVPAGLALYIQYPDWSLMYFVNPVQLPGLLAVPALISAYLGAPTLGFWATHRLLRRRPDLLRLSLGILAFITIWVLGLGYRRFFTVAYYEAFHYGGHTVSLFRSPLLLALLIMIPAVVASFIFTLLLVQRAISHELSGSRGRNLP